MNDALLHGLGSAWSVILRVSLESSLLLGFVVLVSLVYGNRLSPLIRGLLWALVAIRLVLPFTPPSHWSVFNLIPSDSVDFAPVAVTPATVEIEDMPLPDFAPGEAVAVAASPSVAWWIWLPSLVWLTGFLVILVRAIALQIRTARWVDSRPSIHDPWLRQLLQKCASSVGLRRGLDMVEGPEGSSVAVFGFLQASCLIVPKSFRAQYSEAQIRGIFLHELEHVRQRDLLWNWVMLLIQAVHWFNPLVWLAGRSFRAERELRCDRFAVERLSREERVGYGRALLQAVEVRIMPVTAPAFLPFISRKKELKHRMTMILKPCSYQPLTQIAVGIVALAVGFTTFTSALADEAKPGASAEEGTAKVGPREGDGAVKAGPREGDGAAKTGPRDGEGAAKAGPRDGEGAAKAGPRDGEGAAKAGPREGDGAAKAGPRDGEGAAKMGPKDGEGAAKTGPRDGEGGAKAEGGDAKPTVAALLNTKHGRVFKAYDKDNSGGVTIEEIGVMTSEGGKPSRSDLREIEDWIKDFDTDGKKGELTVEEFVRWRTAPPQRER